MSLPKIKKDLTKFILSEDGKISKKSIVVVGASIATLAVSGGLLSQQVEAGYITTNDVTHTNSAGLSYAEPTATADHAHHLSHKNHISCAGKC